MNSEIPKNKEGFFTEIIKFTLIALAIVIPIRAYVAQPFIVDGPSMDPTFATGQYLIVDQISYRLEKPNRDDVIIFRYPNNPKIFFIKRIIGMPGERLSVDTGQITVINKDNPDGFILNEKYITDEYKTPESFDITLGDTEYFVMGDNRPKSSDSRTWGPLDEKYIVGRPFLRLIPFSKISIFPGR